MARRGYAADAAVSYDLAQWLMRFERKTYIAILEAIAVLSLYITYPRHLAGRRVLHFVDNTVALSALVHGYVGKEDLAGIVNAYHAIVTGLRAWPYLEYVPSKANIADLPSRMDYLLVRGVGLRAMPGKLRVPTRTELAGPIADWIDRGAEYARDVQWPS